MSYLQITNFGSINTNTDPRRIKPNKDDEGTAEAVEMVNMDITREGSLVTSTGFELVSSGGSGNGIKNLLTFDQNETNRFLIITDADRHYSITPSNTVWNNLGDYGDEATLVGGTVYFGSNADRRAYLGNNLAANTAQEVSGVPAMAASANVPDGHIMEAFMGRLFVAGDPGAPTTLYYSNVEDETDFAGGGFIKFNDVITGLKVEGQRLIVFTRTYYQGVIFGFDDNFAISTPQKEPFERAHGCLAWRTVERVGSGAIYLSERGVMVLGAEEGFDEQGIPRVRSLSTKIEPSLKFITKSQREKADAVYHENEQQYWLAVPYDGQQENSLVFVYNETWDAWSTRSGFSPSAFAFLRNSNYEPELYFGDAYSSNLYKFNNSYSYDGFEYTRRWKSKKFTMGSGRTFKEFRRIDIAGSMDTATSFDVTIQVDNKKKKYRIDNSFLISDGFGNYIGDNWIGDALLGGGEPDEIRFKRFYVPIDFDKEIREGIELQITIENSAEEQPFKIDFIGIEYEMKHVLQVPRKRFANTQIPT